MTDGEKDKARGQPVTPGVGGVTVFTVQTSPYSRDAVRWSGPTPDTWQELDMSQGFLTS